ncbi:MAG: hypothetical protein WC728_14435 [Elusimicrobiota bacterium]
MKRDAHTRIFHELLEPLLRLDLTGVQFRIILWVARNSYGRGGAFFAPYSWRRIGKDLRADRRGVARQGADLLQRGILRPGGDGELGISKDGIRSLALGLQSQGDSSPMGLGCTKEGTTVPGYSYKKEKRNPANAGVVEPSNSNGKTSPQQPGPAPSPLPEGFAEFWTAYPRRVGRQAALRVWKRLRPDVSLCARIMRAVETQRRCDQWMKDGGQFIPHPTTWLNQGRWDDEVSRNSGGVNDTLYD